MAHTPGPWLAREPEDGELHEIYAENGGDLICYPVWTANQQANIPLIAAAPELLGCLRSLRIVFASLEGWRDMDATLVDQLISSDGLHRIDAVIAKAEVRSE